MIRDVKTGENCNIVEPVNLYDCTIGGHCMVGPFVEIQGNVTIGNKVRIQSHSFICENTQILDSTFIGHGVMFTNDKFTDGKLTKDFLPTKVGYRCRIGSNVTILPVSICDDVVIGAGSVVTKDITRRGVYAGNPAVRIK